MKNSYSGLINLEEKNLIIRDFFLNMNSVWYVQI